MIDKSLEEGTPVEGTIISEVKGGFMVDIGVSAFLPISQVDVKPVKNPASFIGRHLKYKVIKVNQKKANVIVSRRMLIEEEKERKRKEFWKNVKEGQVIYGFVKSITDYGAFIDLGGVDGFLYVNDITWGRITHPKEYLKLGDEVKVKVMAIDHEKHKVSVSIKDLKGRPVGAYRREISRGLAGQGQGGRHRRIRRVRGARAGSGRPPSRERDELGQEGEEPHQARLKGGHAGAAGPRYRH